MDRNGKQLYKDNFNQNQDLIYYPQVVTDPKKVKKYNLKKLYDLSKPGPGILDFKVDGSVWRDGKILTEPCSYEQKQWALHKLKGPACIWRPYC